MIEEDGDVDQMSTQPLCTESAEVRETAGELRTES
jgi:hypothetical protein